MRPISPMLAAVAILAGCSSPHAPWESCILPGSIDGGVEAGVVDAGGAGATACAAPFTCQLYHATGTDGLCHGVGSVCTLQCTTDQDCSMLGSNAVCSHACPGPAVCTPFQ